MKNYITKTIDLDHDVLFGEIGSVIKHLQNIKSQYKNGEIIYLNEEWSGYEDNYFQIVVKRLETDAECKARLEQEDLKFKKAEVKRRKDFAEQKRKEGIKQQIDKLKEQL